MLEKQPPAVHVSGACQKTWSSSRTGWSGMTKWACDGKDKHIYHLSALRILYDENAVRRECRVEN